MILFVLIWFGLALVALPILVCVLANRNLDKRGLKSEKKVRRMRRTYNSGFGNYTVDMKQEEWITKPKD